MNLIVEADVLTRGLLMGNGTEGDGGGAGFSQAGPSDSGVNLSEEERRKVEDGELPHPWGKLQLICAFQPSRLGCSSITRNGADVKALYKNNQTLLHRAEDEEFARLLLEHSADANALDINNQSLLHRASEFWHVGAAQALLKHGVDANA